MVKKRENNIINFASQQTHRVEIMVGVLGVREIEVIVQEKDQQAVKIRRVKMSKNDDLARKMLENMAEALSKKIESPLN